MDEPLSYLGQFALLTESDALHIRECVQEVSLARDDYFLDIDEIPKALCFVKQGVLRAGCYNEKGEDVTRRFVEERHFLLDAFVVTRRLPSREFVQASVDSRLITLSHERMKHLSLVVRGWDTMMAMIAVRMLTERVDCAHKATGNATVRYKTFVRTHPGLLDRIGLCHIASCLGISTSTLSKIRRKVKGGSRTPPILSLY